MRYELHVQGNPPSRFATEHEVFEAASKAIRSSRNVHVQVIDRTTGQAALFTDRRTSHEEYKKRVNL